MFNFSTRVFGLLVFLEADFAGDLVAIFLAGTDFSLRLVFIGLVGTIFSGVFEV